MKKMSKKITTLALAGLMLATPIANLTGLTADAAARAYKRKVVIDIPEKSSYLLTNFGGYVAFIVNAKTGSKTRITTEYQLVDYNEYRMISIESNSDYYVQVCFLDKGRKYYKDSNCVKTGTVKLTDTTFATKKQLKATVTENRKSLSATVSVK